MTRQDINVKISKDAETAKMLLRNIDIGKQSINTNCKNSKLYI